MTYIVNWTQTGSPPNGKPSITLPPLTIDTTSTSLTLTGKGTPNYGETQQENFLRLLENFASPTSPSNPTFGQIWFNSTEQSLYVFGSDNTWKQVGSVTKAGAQPPQSVDGDLWWNISSNTLSVKFGTEWKQIWPSMSVVPIASTEEYNVLVSIYNKVAGTPNTSSTLISSAFELPADQSSISFDGIVTPLLAPSANYPDLVKRNFGFGQTEIPLAVGPVTNEMWVNLLEKFAAVANHEGLQGMEIATRGFNIDNTSVHGVVTGLSEYNKTLKSIQKIEVNHCDASPLSLESAVLANSTYSRTSSYFNSKDHIVAFDFVDLNHVKAFFNSGGKFKITANFTPSQSTAFTSTWQSFIASVGNIVFSASGTSVAGEPPNGPTFYDLVPGGAYVTLAHRVSSISGSYGAYVNVKARLETLPNSSMVTLRFTITYAPDGMNSVYHNAYGAGVFGSGTSSAIGTTVSTITTTKASELYLNNPEIAYPVASQSGSFITDPSA